jgi:hypothetical protein
VFIQGVKFVVRKFAGRWSFGTADQSFVTFDTKERAIEHGREIVRRIPGTELVVVDPPSDTGTEWRVFSPHCDVFSPTR